MSSGKGGRIQGMVGGIGTPLPSLLNLSEGNLLNISAIASIALISALKPTPSGCLSHFGGLL